MEFRSPAFQPVGLPIRTEFRVGWMAEGWAPFRPRADQEEDLRDRRRASAGGSNASKGGCRDQGSERRSAFETAPAQEPPRDERRGSRPGQGQHHGHPAKYRFQRRSSTDAAPPLILISTSDVTAVVSGLISTVAIPAARANSTGAAMYSKRLLVPTLKTT